MVGVVKSLPLPGVNNTPPENKQALELAVAVGRLQRSAQEAGFNEEALLLSMAAQALEERM